MAPSGFGKRLEILLQQKNVPARGRLRWHINPKPYIEVLFSRYVRYATGETFWNIGAPLPVYGDMSLNRQRAVETFKPWKQ